MSFLEIKHIRKTYSGRVGAKETTALKDVNFSVNEGEFISVMGESGSGKTTLLNLLSTLDKPTEGEVTLGGTSLTTIKEKELSTFRREQLGFVFQDFNLLDNFSLKDNILLPLVLDQTSVDEMEKRLQPLVERLGIKELINNYPYEVSGGQKQRAAVARALITNPKLILADEPTGALDSKASETLMTLFSEINKLNQTILMVTHSARAASYSARVVFIRDGEVYHEIYRGEQSSDAFMERISEALLFSFNRGDQDEA